MLRARGPWSPLREKKVSKDASTWEMSMRASDARVTSGATATKGSSISTTPGSSSGVGQASGGAVGIEGASVGLGDDGMLLQIEPRRHRGRVEVVLPREQTIEERARVEARLERHVQVAAARSIGQASRA